MHRYCRSHFADGTLLDHARSSLAGERIATADAVILLKPHLTAENVGELVAAAAWRTREEIELLLAGRFPRLAGSSGSNSPISQEIRVSPGHRPESWYRGDVREPRRGAGPGGVAARAVRTRAGPPGRPVGRARLTPLSADVFDLQVTIGRDTRDLLRRAQDLPGHQLPPGAVGQVLDRALRHYVRHLEKRKFGTTDRPRRGSRAKSKTNGTSGPTSGAPSQSAMVAAART